MKQVSNEHALNLWISFKKGDSNSFEELFQLHYSLLISYGRKFTSDKYIIEESAQDLFVKLWNNRHTLGVPDAVRPYILKSYRSVIFRKLQRLTITAFDQLDETRYTFNLEMGHDQKVIDAEVEEENRKKLEASINKLSSRQREAVYLRFYQDLSYEEIAEVLQIEVGGTYKLIYRALDKLKEELGPTLFIYLITSLSSSSFIS